MSVINEHRANQVLFLLGLENTPVKDRTEEQLEHQRAILNELQSIPFRDLIYDLFHKQIDIVTKPERIEYVDKLIERCIQGEFDPISIGTTVTDAEINDILLPSLYAKQTSLLGAIERVSLYEYQTEALMQKITDCVSIIFSGEKKWKIDSVMSLVFSGELLMYQTNLHSAVTMCKHKKASLDKASAVVSKIISMRTSTNTNPLFRLENKV